MVARVIPEPVTLQVTRETHPENQVAPEKQTTITLGAAVGIGALCSGIGMAFGCAAMSTLFLTGTAAEIASMVPLVVTLVCIVGGWVGAFFYMCREERDANIH